MLSYCLDGVGASFLIVLMTWWSLKAVVAWRQGRARGSYSPLSEANCPPVLEEISGFCWRKFGKMMYKNCIFPISFFPFQPPVRSSCPPSEDCWRHPCLKVDSSLKFQEVFTTQVAHGNFKQSCRWYGIPHKIVLKFFTKKNAYAMVGEKQIEGVSCK